jgi:hypothetical protein
MVATENRIGPTQSGVVGCPMPPLVDLTQLT